MDPTPSRLIALQSIRFWALPFHLPATLQGPGATCCFPRVIEAGEARLSYSLVQEEGLIPHFGEPRLRLWRRIGRADPESVEAYRSDGVYRALEHAIQLGPQEVIREVIASNLVGRGGAAF